MQIRGFVACVLLIVVAGCGGEAPPTAGQERALPPPPPPVAAATDDAVDDTAVVTASDGDTANVGSRKKAEVGLGRKSQNIKGSGYLPTLARTPHRVKESLNLSQATQALNFYKAMNEGRGPKTHEEYMKKVIKENDLKLPKLPEGQRYRYDPDTEELMVEELVDGP
jgi:hypothetical protein